MVFLSSVAGRGVHDPTVLLDTEGGETLTHLSITLSLIFHLAGIPTVHRKSTQTMICSAGGWIFLTLQGLKTFLSDTKNPFVNVDQEKELRVS